jgi:hypothetical protein
LHPAAVIHRQRFLERTSGRAKMRHQSPGVPFNAKKEAIDLRGGEAGDINDH